MWGSDVGKGPGRVPRTHRSPQNANSYSLSKDRGRRFVRRFAKLENCMKGSQSVKPVRRKRRPIVPARLCKSGVDRARVLCPGLPCAENTPGASGCSAPSSAASWVLRTQYSENPISVHSLLTGALIIFYIGFVLNKRSFIIDALTGPFHTGNWLIIKIWLHT